MAQNSLHKLMYASSATSLMTNNELESLMRKSRVKNSYFDVTGCLIYHQGNILQYLEGSKSAVEFIYSSIAMDNRHQGIHLLCNEPIEMRGFDDWSMALRQIPEKGHNYKTVNDLFRGMMAEQRIERISTRARIFFETFLKVGQLESCHPEWGHTQ